MSLKRKSVHSVSGEAENAALPKETKRVDMRTNRSRGLDTIPSVSLLSPSTGAVGASSTTSGSSRLSSKSSAGSVGVDSLPDTESDDDSLNMQAMLEHLKQVSQKKTSKNRAKLEMLVENAFRQIDDALTFTLREEERKCNAIAEAIQAETKRMQQSLIAWTKEVHQTSEAYSNAMRNLTSQFEKLTANFSRTMQSLTQECTGNTRIEERQKRLHRECQQLLQSIKSELATKPESSGLEGKALPLLLKAFMS